MAYQYLYRIVIIGDSCSGKSSFLHKYITNAKIKNPLPTIGVDFDSKIVSSPNNKKVKVLLWDTSGNKNYRSIARSYFSGVAGAILLYNTECRDTFENLTSWINDFRYTNNYNNIPIMLIGTILNYNRQVSTLEATNFAIKNKLFYSEVNLEINSSISSEKCDILQPMWDYIWNNFVITRVPCPGIKRIEYGIEPPPPPENSSEDKQEKKNIAIRFINELKEHANDMRTTSCVIS